jgi:hypothetical protein
MRKRIEHGMAGKAVARQQEPDGYRDRQPEGDAPGRDVERQADGFPLRSREPIRDRRYSTGV